jgi:Ala-tRNA(Pro) deacylase
MSVHQGAEAVPPPHTPADVVAVLDHLGIAHTLYHHQAVFSVAEAEAVEASIPAAHCRNLFVRDQRERMFLISLRNRTPLDLKKLAERLGCGRLSFGSSERLMRYLGVKPGSVCAFAVMNDAARAVTLVLEAEMMAEPLVSFHPLLNTMTVTLAPHDLVRYARHFGHGPMILSLVGLGREALG